MKTMNNYQRAAVEIMTRAVKSAKDLGREMASESDMQSSFEAYAKENKRPTDGVFMCCVAVDIKTYCGVTVS